MLLGFLVKNLMGADLCQLIVVSSQNAVISTNYPFSSRVNLQFTLSFCKFEMEFKKDGADERT